MPGPSRVSKLYLQSLFLHVRFCISLSPVSYLSDYRVRMAAKLLRTTGKTVIEVSEACGFSSPGYFGRVFKETLSTTPKAYQMGKREKDIL